MGMGVGRPDRAVVNMATVSAPAPTGRFDAGQVRLAIVLPLFKQSDLVWEALATALDQINAEPYAVVLVNDGCPFASSHETGRLVAHADRPAPVVYARQSNRGLSGARNTGVNIALERFPALEAIYFLDADNRLTPRSVRNMQDALTAHPEADWFYPDIQTFGLADHFSMEGRYNPAMHAELNICEAGSLVRRRIFDAGVRYDESMKKGYEDWEFWLAALDAGFETARHLPSIEYRYRRRPESMLADSHRFDGEIRNYMLAKHPWLETPEDRFAKNRPADDPEAWLAVITPEGGAYMNAPRAGLDRSPISRIRDDLWRWRIKPGAYGFPRRVLFADTGVLDALETAKILDWCVWDMAHRLTASDAHVVSVRLSASGSDSLSISNPYTTSAETRPRTGLTMIDSALFADTLMESYPQWLSALLSGAGEGPVHQVRDISLPDASQPPADAADSSRSLVETSVRFHSADYHAALDAWTPVAAGTQNRVGRPRTFLADARGGDLRFLPKRSDRKQIAFTMPFADFGGVERVAYQIARVLDAEGYDCHLVIMSHGAVHAPEEFRSAFRSISWFPSHEVASYGRGPFQGTFLTGGLPPHEEEQLLGLLSGMDVVINCHSPDVRHVAARLKRRGVLCIDHQHIVERTPAGQPVGHPFQGLAYEHAFALFLTCSEQLKRWLRNHGIAEEKLIAVPNGPGLLTTDRDFEAAQARLDAQDLKETAGRKLRAIFLGRLERQKGVDRLAALIARTVETVDWRVIGKAVVESDESAAIKAQGIEIEPPLYRSADIRKAFEWADVMVLPSRFEGLPLVIIDAMSNGVPVIATDVGAAREVIEDKKSGYLLNEDSFIELAHQTIIELDSDRAALFNLCKEAINSSKKRDWKSNSSMLVMEIKRWLGR